MSSVLTTLQGATAKILAADKFFQRVEPLTENLGDINNQIKIALSKLGVSVLVLTPGAEGESTNAPGPILNPVNLVVAIFENVLLNRGERGTKVPAAEFAEYIAWLLHYPNHAATRQDDFPLTFRRIRLVPDKTLLVYNVEFTTRTALAGIVATTP